MGDEEYCTDTRIRNWPMWGVLDDATQVWTDETDARRALKDIDLSGCRVVRVTVTLDEAV